MPDHKTIVLKFGSSVLRSESDLPTAVHEIYRWWRKGHEVVAVVSAFGDTTDELSRRAHLVCQDPDEGLLAALLATGEATSSALLGLALNRAGIPTTVFDAEQARLCTTGPRLNADLFSVDAPRLHSELRAGVVVIPGFVGRGEEGQTTLLGRGGSDLTALFLAQKLGGHCRLIKDVDGLYTSDPNSETDHNATRFAQVSYRTAAKIGGAVVQLKAVEYAERHRLPFSISSIGSNVATEVGPHSDSFSIDYKGRPLRVALLGCGTVGGGVYQRLAALPELFEVVGVGTRNIDRAIDEEVPVRLITTKLGQLLERDVEVVIELLGGLEPARSLIIETLRRGQQVITANKALLATDIYTFENLSKLHGTTIRYSAAVGGVTPALETLHRVKEAEEVTLICGVLNGTTNFLFDEIAKGKKLTQALAVARKLGYTEADPQFDLDGTDAAQKLSLLARVAFDLDLPFAAILRKGIQDIEDKSIPPHTRVRLVAQCRRLSNHLEASVGPVALALDHPLAQVYGVGNRLLIETKSGQQWTVSGRGAGRWPTTEAVMSDLFDVLSVSRSFAVLDEAKERVA